MNRVNNKRKELGDMTDQLDNLANRDIKQPRLEAKHMLPDLDTKLKDQNEKAVPRNFYLQNVHPWLAMYKHDFVTTHRSAKNSPQLVLKRLKKISLHNYVVTTIAI